jgi:thymidine phosphorylase
MIDTVSTQGVHSLKLRRVGIDTHQEHVIFMRSDCHVCRAEGFAAQARIQVRNGEHSIIATLNVVTGDLLAHGEAGLSEVAWLMLGAREGDRITLSHAPPLESLSQLRTKIYGKRLGASAMSAILRDVAAGLYSDIHLSSFVTACAGDRMDLQEIVDLTRAMIDVGERLDWEISPVVDKHCVGGLPGNRTTLLVVPIVSAFGMVMPKTSSRAITSPAGTADTMETLAPVNLDLSQMRSVVEREGGCIAWGGSIRLSPADDVLIRVERALDLDSEGQLVASVLSKKAAAGSTHVVIDIPVGPTAKVRTLKSAETLEDHLVGVGRAVGLKVQVAITDGSQPVGRGIGPALEARDVVAVLHGWPDAPADLRERALVLAGHVLEFSPEVPKGTGKALAQSILDSGQALRKFQAICEAQGGMREPPRAAYTNEVLARSAGRIAGIDNRRLARVAKLAGAPTAPASGLDLHTSLEARVDKGQPLFTVHAEAPGELAYALDYVKANPDIVQIQEAR